MNPGKEFEKPLLESQRQSNPTQTRRYLNMSVMDWMWKEY